MAKRTEAVLVDQIEPLIVPVRQQNVILDGDLAALYGVPTRRLNEQVKRNRERFPEDFVFRLSAEEADALRSQIAISKSGRGGRRYLPYAFTEHGAIMAATVLNSPEAVEVSVYVVRAFVKLREFVLQHRELSRQVQVLERKVGSHDEAIRQIVAAIRELMQPPDPPPPRRGRIGFGREHDS